MKKGDYGFYGKGIDGYVHYKQAFDESQKNRPAQKSSTRKVSKHKAKNEKREIIFDRVVTIVGGIIAISIAISFISYMIPYVAPYLH